jgi:hypothetical protein
VYASLPIETGDSIPNLAPSEQFNNLLQIRVSLANDLVQLNRLHFRFLQLCKRAARLDSFVLSRVTDQQNAVIRVQALDEVVHLARGREGRLVQDIQPTFDRIWPTAFR